jgi:NAD(P)H-hydrate repair Nnr-like enzyme with NAD(P)H-hydrate dehydratase domain
MRAIGLAILLLAAGARPGAAAAPLDGSAAMKCAIDTVMICSDPSVCVRGTAATALLPPVMVVDVPNRRLSGDGSGRTIKIVWVGHGQGRMLLHGEEVVMSGTAWNMVVDETSGEMTGAALTQAGGFIVFGKCSGS